MSDARARAVTLGHLSVERVAPPDYVTQAAKAGFISVGIRFWDGFTNAETWPMRVGSPMLRETMERLSALGVATPEIENNVLQPTTNVDDYKPMFETGAALKASRVVIGSIVDDEARCTDMFARLCEVAAPYDLTIALEFYLKWHGCASIAQGRRIIGAANQPNGKLLVDALHLNRSRGTPADLAAMPPDFLCSLQLCDAAAAIPSNLDDISRESRFERMLPGEGGLPLADVVRAFPAHLPLGIEIPNRPLEDSIGSQAYLTRCYATTQKFLGALEPTATQ
jgi:sugar phosphate isomerase/epimerase